MYEGPLSWSVPAFHAGEIVVVARVPRSRTASDSLARTMHDALLPHAAERLAGEAARRTFVFDAPDEDRSLVFSFHDLKETAKRDTVRDLLQSLHGQRGQIGGDDIEVIGAMPHWHVRAHDSGSGPSPGSFARPVYPDQVPYGWTSHFYQPVNREFDVEGDGSVPVAVLDAQLDLPAARTAAEKFSQRNPQLLDTVRWLQDHALEGEPPYEQEFKALEPRHADRKVPPEYAHIPDHGLFIAGLIHGLAPRAPISLEPVLEANGIGDLSLLLLGLDRVVRSKQQHEPRIINLSLGLLPHPARLAATWYGLGRQYDPEYWRDDALHQADHDQRWVIDSRTKVDDTVELLQEGLWELGRYLRLNNCLVIAAAGNDSLPRVDAGQGRMDPRLPARLENVLGVAATTSDPRRPAPYSNVGDELELGDHVATFGGNLTQGLEPHDGVIGVYSSETLPFNRPNETGWAYWSGTSFATGIVSGIAANYWAQRPHLKAGQILGEFAAEARRFGPYVPDLRTPSIEVIGRWH